MNRNERARDAVVERLVKAAKQGWEQWPQVQRASTLLRICSAGGISAEDAMARINGSECPHCTSTNLDRGETGLDDCQVCGGLSRAGKPL